MAMSNKAKVSNLNYLTENVGTKVCRALFQKRCTDMRPQNEDPATWTVDMFLKVNMKKIRILNLNQNSEQVLFPAGGQQTNILSWDLSLVLKILKAICEIGKDLEKKLSDLQTLRNELAHLGDSNIDDTKYNRYVKQIQYIYDEVLKELKDKELETKIQEMFRKSNAGEIPDYELLQAMQALQLSCDDIKKSGEETRNTVTFEHTETRNIVIKGQTEVVSLLKQLIASKDNGHPRPPTTVPVKLKPMNATNETDEHLTQVMIALFNEVIEQTPELSDLSNKTLDGLRDVVQRFYTTFKKKGYEIVKAEKGCILLHVQFELYKSLFSFYSDYISGELDIYVDELEKASKGYLSFEEFQLEMILYEDDLCQVLHDYIDNAEEKGHLSIGHGYSEGQHNDADRKDLYVQDGGSTSVLLTFKPLSHFDGKEFETVLESESKLLIHKFKLPHQSSISKSEISEKEKEITGQEGLHLTSSFKKESKLSTMSSITNSSDEWRITTADTDSSLRAENERLKHDLQKAKEEVNKTASTESSLRAENDRLRQHLKTAIENIPMRMKCQNDNCGKIGKGKFCSECGTPLIPNFICCAKLQDGSKCQEQINDKGNFCKGCQEKVDAIVQEIKSKQSSEHPPPTVSEVDKGIGLIERSLPPQAPGTSDDEISELRRIAQGGAEKIKNYLEEKNNEWRKIALHVGVTGASGSGKSSFINAIRGIEKHQKGYAEIGVVETTSTVKPYPHPENPSLIFWDMPGVGTRSFPKDTYLRDVRFTKYEFFLIVFHKRFGEGDAWLAKQAKACGKSCFFVRTHIDIDVLNDRRVAGKNHSKEDVLKIISDNCAEELGSQGLGSEEFFLIDNHEIKDYDFDRLTTRLVNDGFLDEQKRNAFVLSLTVLTDGIIEKKKKAMEDRIWKIAFASAAGGAVPIPGFGALIDTGIILSEYAEYRLQFGLTDEKLKKESAYEIIARYGRNAAQIVLCIGLDETVENVFKLGIPIIGSIASGTISYAFTVGTLKKLLNEVVEDAKHLNEKMMHAARTSSGI